MRPAGESLFKLPGRAGDSVPSYEAPFSSTPPRLSAVVGPPIFPRVLQMPPGRPWTFRGISIAFSTSMR